MMIGKKIILLNRINLNDHYIYCLCFCYSVCGNSAYILGSTVEFEAGLKCFVNIFSNDRIQNSVDIVRILCQLLTHSDSECVLNAAGTLGTIVCRLYNRNF